MNRSSQPKQTGCRQPERPVKNRTTRRLEFPDPSKVPFYDLLWKPGGMPGEQQWPLAACAAIGALPLGRDRPPYQSSPGRMHACSLDGAGETAPGLAVTSQHANLIFQPAEKARQATEKIWIPGSGRCWVSSILLCLHMAGTSSPAVHGQAVDGFLSGRSHATG